MGFIQTGIRQGVVGISHTQVPTGNRWTEEQMNR